MDKELALRTFGYLIGHYKTHDETIINSQEIEAIEFILKDNEDLEQQVKKQKKVIDKTIEYIQNHQLVFKDATLEEIEEWFNQFYIDVLDILNEVEK